MYLTFVVKTQFPVSDEVWKMTLVAAHEWRGQAYSTLHGMGIETAIKSPTKHVHSNLNWPGRELWLIAPAVDWDHLQPGHGEKDSVRFEIISDGKLYHIGKEIPF